MRQFIHAVLLGLGALLLAGCAPAPVIKPDAQVLVWPAPPDVAKVQWQQSISRPEDLGIRRSFMQQVSDFLFGKNDSAMVRPMAVVVVDKIIYVADPGVKGVHRFDSESGDYRLILAADGSPLMTPVGMARCGNQVLLTDSSRGQVYSIGKDDLGAKPLLKEVALVQPTGIACDAATNLVFVSDTASHYIRVFRLVGDSLKLERDIGKRGAGPGEFNFPTYLWWSNSNRLYVSDALNFRIQIFDRVGHAIGQFGKLGDSSGDAARLKGIATDSHNHVYAVDSLFHAFQIFNEQGQLLLGVGDRGNDAGEFWLPTGIFIEQDRIYVADSYNSRVQVFRFLETAQ